MKRVGKRGEDKFEQISWDEAIDTIASELKRIREAYGDESITVHYASGVSSGLMGNAVVNRLINLNGGCLNYYGSYSSAHISAAGTYTYGGGTYGSNFSPCRTTSWWSCSATALLIPVWAALAIRTISHGCARRRTSKSSTSIAA